MSRSSFVSGDSGTSAGSTEAEASPSGDHDDILVQISHKPLKKVGSAVFCEFFPDFKLNKIEFPGSSCGSWCLASKA